MANDHDEVERTEAASPRWLAHARERGFWPHSTELVVACSLLGAILTVRVLASPLANSLLGSLNRGLSSVELTVPRGGSVFNWHSEIVRPLVLATPLLLIPAIVAAISGIGQSGLRLRPEGLMPDASRLIAAQRLLTIFSGRSAKESVVAATQWSLLLALTGWWLWNDVAHMPRASGQGFEPLASVASNALLNVGTKLALALVVLGLVDYGRAWWSYQQDVRMSRAQLIAELREMEGDPLLRRRRRQRQLDQSMAKSGKAVEPGDLVLLGKVRLAVVIRFSGRSSATVLTKCIGTSADYLQRRARTTGARVLRHDSLARSIHRQYRTGNKLPPDICTTIDALLSRLPLIPASNKGRSEARV